VAECEVVVVVLVRTNDIRGAVRGVIVDDDDSVTVIDVLSNERVEGRFDTCGVVVGGNDDGNRQMTHATIR